MHVVKYCNLWKQLMRSKTMNSYAQQELESEYWGRYDSVAEAYAATKADCEEFARSEIEAEEYQAEVERIADPYRAHVDAFNNLDIPF